MRIPIKLSFLVLSLVAPLVGFGQLTIDAQYRNRIEFRDGYRILIREEAYPAVFVSQRFRLTFNYQSEKFKLRFTPQDVRIWGDENISSSTGVFGDNASLDLYEGFIELKAGKNIWFSIGRQPFKYDNQRILGARNWNQLGMSYDALLVKMHLNGWNIHAAGSWNSMNERISDILYPNNRMKTLNFLWLNKAINQNLTTSLLHIASGTTETDTTNTLHFRQTTGIYCQYSYEGLSAWANLYYQYGKNNDGIRVNAYLIDGELNYELGKFNIGVGGSYLSGNSEIGTEQTEDRLFDVLYGARHRFFGDMDHFRDFSRNTNEGGLTDIYFNLGYEPITSITISNTIHYFQLAQTNITTPTDKSLGYENDFIAKYNFMENGSLEFGYAFMIPTESLKSMQGIDTDKTPQFIYLMLTFNATILNIKQ